MLIPYYRCVSLKNNFITCQFILVLSVKNLSKSFPGVKALQNVNLTFYAGKINALLGENGAGKSTLLKILTGAYPDYEGEIYLKNQLVHFGQIKDAQQAGIAIIHQELNLVPELSITENIFLGREILNAWALPDDPAMHTRTQQLLTQLGLEASPQSKVSRLKIGEQQLVEIAKALLTDAQVILMDEPTSALSEKEISNLHRLVRQLRDSGKTIVYISHKMDELFQLAETYTILRDGQVVAAGELNQTTENELIRFMVGREVFFTRLDSAMTDKRELLRVNKLSMPHPTLMPRQILDNISFQLYAGEVLSIFGLLGAGRTELLHAIFGITPLKQHGQLWINQEEVKINSPREAIYHGLALVTEDRKAEGLVLGMDVEENISLTTLPSGGLVNKNKEAQLAQKYISELNIKTPSAQQLCLNLSGGNQQKVVLAKWLATQPDILMLDEPTRGIDINAKNEIYVLIKALAAEGKGILIASSEIPEILALSDRILVLSSGKITAEFAAHEATEEKLLQSALPK